MKSICVLRGDGIGPEVIDCAIDVLDAVTDDLEYVYASIGNEAFSNKGSRLPEDTLQTMTETDSCLFGAVTSASGPLYDSPVLRFRSELDLYANVRPVRDIAHHRDSAVDILIVRENTEGLYTGHEVEVDDGVTTMRRVSRRAVERIVAHAINLAEARGRGSVCCVHKANVLRESDGLFLREFRRAMTMKEGQLAASDQLVDSAAAKLVTSPEEFDVIVTLNLYGDILSDVAAAVVGGLGFAPSGNIGPRHSVFEPAHGSAPDIAGRGIANPTAAILSAGMMLDHLGMSDQAARIASAVSDVYRHDGRTIDICGSLGSRAFTEEVVRRATEGR